MSRIEKGQRHRRELLRLLAIGLGLGTFAVSTVCGAQQSGKAYRVGFLRGTSPPHRAQRAPSRAARVRICGKREPTRFQYSPH